MRVLGLMALGLLAGCPDGGDGSFIGDPNQDPEVQLIYLGVDNRTYDLAPGGEVPLIEPPQGGKVLFIGARVRNVAGGVVSVMASLRDTCDNRIVALEMRPVTIVENDAGWGEPQNLAAISSYANLAACPNAGAQRDVNSDGYEVTVEVEDRGGRMGTATMAVAPTCEQTALVDECRCECDRRYILGEACPPDDTGTGPGPVTCQSQADGGPWR